jgi:hypothetical protein
LVFIDEGEDSIMAGDVVMFSNPPVMLVKGEELEETLFNMNDHAKKNCPKKWCASESIIQHGIVDYLLTHMP